ncbi:extracellular matrix-binding ebh, putative [Babesia caballi]|uniref:Extracellular matrix-binding ebh, putative n=1 Tax=Babesia caballi TaxID=5871 RepID=A0AAV4LZ13_BABCB|nr:extracellular matrix-binding ebh, putative [Babesia caballi]
MGFAGKLRTDAGGGLNIAYALGSFCGGFNTPLRQLSEKLGCLTKRTPRTLGDIFGFVWHLNGQLFKRGKSAEESLKEFLESIGFANYAGSTQTTADQFFQAINNKITGLGSSQPQSGIDKSLTVFFGLPFLYQLFMVKPGDSLPAVLFKIKNIPHQAEKEPKYSGKHDDLYSLYNPVCKTQEKNCGPYLYPITHSDGATFAPTHASTYLSWVIYLTDDLQSWFQDMLDEFKNIDCKVSGCMDTKCKSHAPGTHGNPSNCDCESVVHCGGTLPLLYRHGFRFHSPHTLSGGSTGNDNSKRSCDKFHSALSNVISGNPLSNLLTSIDTFLYLFRFYFLGNLSGFWTIYICIILYTFFFLLDTLHLRSHLRLTASHVVPPIAMLTSSTPLPITKLTYIGQ